MGEDGDKGTAHGAHRVRTSTPSSTAGPLMSRASRNVAAARPGPIRPGLTTYRKSSPGAPQAVDVALPRRVQLGRGSERLVADSRPIGTGLLWGPTETQTETLPSRAAPRAARRTGIPAGHRGRKRGDSNPRSLAGRSLSSGADARSHESADKLTCMFSDASNPSCATEPT